MAGEETNESISVTLPPDVVDWLNDRAEEDDVDRGGLVADLVSAYRTIAASNGDIDEEISPLGVSEEVERRLESQREEYVDLIEDVRERVIQVKRETDAKAPADHDHEEIETALDRVEELSATVSELDATLARVERDLENGFENYEDVLRYLKQRSESARQDLDTVATAVLEVRSSLERVAAESAARAEADRLKAEANRRGFRTADCEDCGSSVDVSLLAKARCPHCSATFVDVEPKDRFFGSNTLVTGSAPALEGSIQDETAEDLAGVAVAGDREFDWQTDEGAGDRADPDDRAETNGHAGPDENDEPEGNGEPGDEETGLTNDEEGTRDDGDGGDGATDDAGSEHPDDTTDDAGTEHGEGDPADGGEYTQ